MDEKNVLVDKIARAMDRASVKTLRRVYALLIRLMQMEEAGI